MIEKNKDKTKQISRPLIGRGLRALALRHTENFNLAETVKAVVEKPEDLCATTACRKSGTITL
ncbi:MAG: hypothetical protein AAGA76_04405 [Pseudomonadota bacterium]